MDLVTRLPSVAPTPSPFRSFITGLALKSEFETLICQSLSFLGLICFSGNDKEKEEKI